MEAAPLNFTDREKIEQSVSDNGTVHLSWAGGTEVELQQAADESFGSPVTRYRGADRGSVITGLAEGTHWFRIREAPAGEWSAPLAVNVEFFPQGKLFVILGLGGVVVLATMGTIIAGHLKIRAEEVEP